MHPPAWLIADHEAVRAVFDSVQAPAIEGLSPRAAKDILNDWIRLRGKDSREARLSLARRCRLDEVARRCPEFGAFQQELARKNPLIAAS